MFHALSSTRPAKKPVTLFWAALALAVAGSLPPFAAASDTSRWDALRQHYFGDREIHDGRRVLALMAPERAANAAVVPVSIRVAFPQSEERYVKTVTLLVDNNPSPLAGRFHLTLASGKANIATRIRVNDFTDIRAVAELNDGSLHMVKRYVMAAGGCSAPVPMDMDATLARMGKMKLKRSVRELAGQPNLAQLMISHPNFSGMQTDAATNQYVPADFVHQIEVRHGDNLVMKVETDISISENPNFRFYYSPVAEGELSVFVKDTSGRSFSQSW